MSPPALQSVTAVGSAAVDIAAKSLFPERTEGGEREGIPATTSDSRLPVSPLEPCGRDHYCAPRRGADASPCQPRHRVRRHARTTTAFSPSPT